ncbi:MAG: V-type ATP synthase subunit I, partial [Halobacteriales archaeon]|nr:V-type ATP synthase subunit I [Halobacteriales archaeon]
AGMALAFSALGFELAGGGLLGWGIYLFGFLIIIPLSILAGGLQSVRLQFVEFFQKFFVGGGRTYVPFGRRAT